MKCNPLTQSGHEKRHRHIANPEPEDDTMNKLNNVAVPERMYSEMQHERPDPIGLTIK